MVSANSAKPVSNGDDADRTLIITAVQVDALPVKKIKTVFVTVKSGTSSKKTVELKGKTMPLRWDGMPSLQLDTRDVDSGVSFKLYQKRFIFFNDVLGRVERPLKTFLDPNTRELTGLRIALSNGDLMFSVKFENDTFQAAHHLIKSFPEPAANPAIDRMVKDAELGHTMMSSSTQLRTQFGDLLDSFEPYSRLLDEFSRVHPIAQVVWFVIGSAYKVVKAQHEKDQAICELYVIMMKTYEGACKDDILRGERDFSFIFDDMIKQSIECSLFISGYSTGRYLRRLTRLNISQKIDDFKTSFQNLEKSFTSAEMRVTVETLLRMRNTVDIPNLREILDLPPGYSSLGPKSSCMPRTRQATLSMVTEWIMGGEGSVMWLSGLAGTGKSSVMGSLSDMTLNMGTGSRRAAFVRFDRAENRDPAFFVRQLAYELAKFDSRLGNAIAESARKNPGISQHTQLAEQFSVLILRPLGSKLCEGMKDEGPINVMVDGVDECEKGEMRRQLVALLLEGFKGHPFVRLIVSSRPEEDLTLAFGDHSAFIRRTPLDITSPETKADIEHFITTRISTMGKELQEYCRESDAVSRLSERASGLFIWAATVLKFIEGFPTPERLEKILATEIPNSALTALTTLYQTALGSIASEVADDDDVQSNMRVVLGAIMVSSSQSFRDVANLWHSAFAAHAVKGVLAFRNVHHTEMLLSKMGALVDLEDDNLRLLHKSFDDFLTDQARCGDRWYINIQDHTLKMLHTSLSRILPLLRDPNSFSKNNLESPEIPYACLSWTGCVIALNNLDSLSSEILAMLAELFRMYLLRWLIICLQLNAGKVLKDTFTFTTLCDVSDKVGQSELSEDLYDLLFNDDGAFYSTDQTLSRNCFNWLRHQPSSSPLRQIYLPAYVETAGSNKFSDIIAVMEKNRIPPVGVKDSHDVEIVDIPSEDVIPMQRMRRTA